VRADQRGGERVEQRPRAGTFHFALRSRPNGDTCVQARASNGASLVITEVMGDATYQVKPNERVLFRNGRLADAEASPADIEDCGCPPPAPPVLRAEAPKPAPEPAPTTQPVLLAAQNPPTSKPDAPASEHAPESKTHVEVDSPFVFRAEDLRNEDTRKADQRRNNDNVPPAERPLRASLATLPGLPAVAALPPAETSAAPAPPKKKGAFARLRSFFGALFK